MRAPSSSSSRATGRQSLSEPIIEPGSSARSARPHGPCALRVHAQRPARGPCPDPDALQSPGKRERALARLSKRLLDWRLQRLASSVRHRAQVVGPRRSGSERATGGCRSCRRTASPSRYVRAARRAWLAWLATSVWRSFSLVRRSTTRPRALRRRGRVATRGPRAPPPAGRRAVRSTRMRGVRRARARAARDEHGRPKCTGSPAGVLTPAHLT